MTVNPTQRGKECISRLPLDHFIEDKLSQEHSQQTSEMEEDRLFESLALILPLSPLIEKERGIHLEDSFGKEKSVINDGNQSIVENSFGWGELVKNWEHIGTN